MTINKLDPSIIRILNTEGVSANGAGLLVCERYVLTCAHVVRAAMGLKSAPPATPQAEISLDFPFLGKAVSKARVIAWYPHDHFPNKGDVALLELVETLPSGPQPYTLSMSDPVDLKDHSFSVIGFPIESPKGAFSHGKIKEIRPGGLVQLVDVNTKGMPIVSGFSGAPVWDETLEHVVGMIVTSVELSKIAFMASVKTILTVCPQLPTMTTSQNKDEGAFAKTVEVNKGATPNHFIRRCFERFDYAEIQAFCKTYFTELAQNINWSDKSTRDAVVGEIIFYCAKEDKFEDLWNHIRLIRPTIYTSYYDQWVKTSKANS